MNSQYWDRDRLTTYRTAWLGKTLDAAAAIPFYRARFAGVPRPADLENMPILRRADLADLNQSVRALRDPRTEYLRAKSSGSTGQSVEILFDSQHQRGRFAARARYLRANGWSPLSRSAWLIGIRPGSPDGNLVHSRFLPGAKFFSHLEDFETQVAGLRKLAPRYIYTLPSNLEALLAIFANQDQRLPTLRRVFTGGEVLEDSIRDQTRRILGVEISDNYGSTEAFLAWQCPSGSYHINSEHVLIEIVDEQGIPVARGNPGRVLVTTLENHLMPLIRYDLGDFAIVLEEPCPCGRTLPRIGRILGRSINLFRLPGGRLLSPWQLVEPLKALPEVRQVQILQQSLDQYVVRYAAARSLEPDAERSIRDGFRAIVGVTASVAFEQVAEIPRGAGGKFMAAVSALAGSPQQ